MQGPYCMASRGRMFLQYTLNPSWATNLIGIFMGYIQATGLHILSATFCAHAKVQFWGLPLCQGAFQPHLLVHLFSGHFSNLGEDVMAYLWNPDEPSGTTEKTPCVQNAIQGQSLKCTSLLLDIKVAGLKRIAGQTSRPLQIFKRYHAWILVAKGH